jgi:Domain of unknown function (DUF4863)
MLERMTSTQVSADATAQAQSRFKTRLAAVTAQIHNRPLNSALDEWLNTNLGTGTPTYRELKQSCEEGVAQGWLCKYEGGGLRYGRIFKPSDDLHGFSVDVVDMENVAGPHHVHPQGEIDLIMPIEGDATFDGRPAGWLVCPPGSAHRPTVTQGRALVLYLLPKGEIEFTK